MRKVLYIETVLGGKFLWDAYFLYSKVVLKRQDTNSVPYEFFWECRKYVHTHAEKSVTFMLPWGFKNVPHTILHICDGSHRNSNW